MVLVTLDSQEDSFEAKKRARALRFASGPSSSTADGRALQLVFEALPVPPYEEAAPQEEKARPAEARPREVIVIEEDPEKYVEPVHSADAKEGVERPARKRRTPVTLAEAPGRKRCVLRARPPSPASCSPLLGLSSPPSSSSSASCSRSCSRSRTPPAARGEPAPAPRRSPPRQWPPPARPAGRAEPSQVDVFAPRPPGCPADPGRPPPGDFGFAAHADQGYAPAVPLHAAPQGPSPQPHPSQQLHPPAMQRSAQPYPPLGHHGHQQFPHGPQYGQVVCASPGQMHGPPPGQYGRLPYPPPQHQLQYVPCHQQPLRPPPHMQPQYPQQYPQLHPPVLYPQQQFPPLHHGYYVPPHHHQPGLPPPQYPLPMQYPPHPSPWAVPPEAADRGTAQPKFRPRLKLRKRLLKTKKKTRKRRVFKPKPTPPPEPTLAESPLAGGGIPGPLAVAQSDAGWVSVLHDEHRRTFVSHRKGAFATSQLREWWSALESQIQWRRPTSDHLVLPRSAAWLTLEGCTCRYEYAGLEFDPLPMSRWFLDIMEIVCRTCGLADRPNSCNANFYDNGSQSVGWHSDDEPLFDAVNRDVLIVSLSLGATRTFELASKDKPTDIIKLPLEDGDLCTMEGLCQKHYRHRVPRQKSVDGPRINLTWRWVLRHSDSCPWQKPS